MSSLGSVMDFSQNFCRFDGRLLFPGKRLKVSWVLTVLVQCCCCCNDSYRGSCFRLSFASWNQLPESENEENGLNNEAS